MDVEQREQRIERDGEKARKGAVAAMWLVFFVVAVIWLGKRDYEWDLLAYTGSVVELGEDDPSAVHATVFAMLDEQAPAEDATALRSKNEYRERLAEDSAAYNAQLPFYRGRVLYIGAMALLAKLGVPALDAAFIISWLGGVTLLIALGLWLRARGGGSGAIVLGNLLALTAVGFCFKAPTKATPDALAAALVIAGSFTLLETRRVVLGLTILGLSLLARVDHIVLIAPLVAWCALGWSGGARVSIKALIVSAAAYLALILVCTAGRETYSPWIVFNHTFFGYMTFPLEETPPFDLVAWVTHSAKSLPQFKSIAPLIFTLAGLATLVAGFKRGGLRDPMAGLALIALFATFVHFALFPALWPRLMFPYWVLTAMALGRSARRDDYSSALQASP